MSEIKITDPLRVKPDAKLPIGFRYKWERTLGAWTIERYRPSRAQRQRAFDPAPPAR